MGPVIALLDGERDWGAFFCLVEESQRPRLEEKRGRAARQSLGAYLLARWLLEENGLSFLRLDRSPLGQPLLREADGSLSGWGLSLAHTGGACACALHRGRVGLDLEPPGRCRPAVARRMFSPAEQAALTGPDPDTAFTRLWTLREALAKYSGQGLARMPQAEFLLEGEGRCSREGLRCRSWQESGWWLGCCWEGEAPAPAPVRVCPLSQLEEWCRTRREHLAPGTFPW